MTRKKYRLLALAIAMALIMTRAERARPQTTEYSRTGDTAGVKPHVPAKDDINAIGRRQISGSGAGNWYSLEKELQMGQEYSRDLESHVHLLNDPIVAEYVNRIGQTLARNSDAKFPFTIKVIDSDEVNAFSLPGGFLYVNSGLISAAEDEAELAGAMAHEIAHIAARHATRQLTRSNMVTLLSVPLIFVGGGIALAMESMSQVAAPLAFSKFSRTFEAEADYLGMQYMYVVGYDPEALISFFEKIQAMEHQKRGTLSRAFASHPQTADRVKKSQAEIRRILPAREQYVVSTSDFDTVKMRLRELQDEREQKIGPILRRTKPSTQSESNDATERQGPTGVEAADPELSATLARLPWNSRE